MRFLLSCLIALTLVATTLPAQAARRENKEADRQPEHTQGFLTTQPVQAQPVDHLGLSAIYSADIFHKSLAMVGKPRLVLDAPPPALPPEQRDALAFEPSTEVERATRHKLLASLLATTQTAAVQDEIRQMIKSDDLWRQFNKVLNGAGLVSTNLADVTAATYLIAGEVINTNDTTAGVQAAAIRAVRDAIAAGMAAQGRIAKLSDAEKQQASSVMAYVSTVAANSADELHRSGNEDALARLREHLHTAVLTAVGVDLDRLRLTDTGFVTR